MNILSLLRKTLSSFMFALGLRDGSIIYKSKWTFEKL